MHLCICAFVHSQKRGTLTQIRPKNSHLLQSRSAKIPLQFRSANPSDIIQPPVTVPEQPPVTVPEQTPVTLPDITVNTDEKKSDDELYRVQLMDSIINRGIQKPDKKFYKSLIAKTRRVLKDLTIAQLLEKEPKSHRICAKMAEN